MRALIQRVSRARVQAGGETISQIGKGLLILLGIAEDDEEQKGAFLADKIVNLRIFGDENDKINLSLLDVKGQAIVVSQFTLYADCRGQRRPSFLEAAKPEKAQDLYEKFIQKIKDAGADVFGGRFGAMMEVELVNDGPVTIMMDTKAMNYE